MKPLTATRCGIPARTMLAVTAGLAMLFFASASIADTQTSEQACSDSAYNYYQIRGFAKKGCGSSTHYNAKLNACFTHLVCESNHGKKIAEFVENIDKHRTEARYINTRPSTPSGSCNVGGEKCRDYYEFQDRIRQFMED